MTKEKSPARQGPRYIFYFLMLAILGWFIFMQFFGALYNCHFRHSQTG